VRKEGGALDLLDVVELLSVLTHLAMPPAQPRKVGYA